MCALHVREVLCTLRACESGSNTAFRACCALCAPSIRETDQLSLILLFHSDMALY